MKKGRNVLNLVFGGAIVLLSFIMSSCVEEIDFVTETFESALVIEATITDEIKPQQILLSRTYRFESDEPNPEIGANVQILTDTGIIEFIEEEPGNYISTQEFAAQANVNYQLSIVTASGRSYQSSPTQLTQATQMDQLYVERENNDDDINGMSIYVDTYDPTGKSQFYRYQFEETYKIIAPRWVKEDLIVVDAASCIFDIVPKTQEERVCYKTERSINYNLANTVGLTEDRLTKHLIRFVPSNDYILSHRYSILVRQYVVSREAYTYYETLNEFNGEGSLFSATQPGFFNGNIFSETNSAEKVIGFFDVTSVTEERIYFNYSDYYEGEFLPPYPFSCNPVAPEFRCDIFISEITRNRIKYFGENLNPMAMEGPYLIVLRPCGDCTVLGENVKPEFWEE